MANIKQEFGTSTAITITLNGLNSSSTTGRESAAIDNSSNKFVDALVTLILTTEEGDPTGEKCAYVYAYGSEDGTNYTDNATGSDASITLRDPTNLKVVAMVNMPSGLTTYKVVFSIAQAFGGILPRKWGIVVRLSCGIALSSSGNSASYSGIYYTSS